MAPFPIILLILTFAAHLTEIFAFPSYASLAGLSEEELARIIPTLEIRVGPPPDLHAKPNNANTGFPVLVHDAAHPFVPPGPDDIRGPCPALNTLANHGYLPHNGVARPSQIIRAVIDGFNMGPDLAALVTYAAHLADGNLLTDELSIGRATGGGRGLNYHGTFEGDASMTRGDAYFSNNYDFNGTLFQNMEAEATPWIHTFDVHSAATHRRKLVEYGIAHNPEFAFNHIRYPAGYAESWHPWTIAPAVKMDVLRTFFQHGKMPAGFKRSPVPVGMVEIATHVLALWAQYPPILPGHNAHGVNTYVYDLTSPTLITWGWIYGDYVRNIVAPLYPNPQGELREALIRNLGYFYEPFLHLLCPKVPWPLPLPPTNKAEGLVDQTEAPVSTGESKGWSMWGSLVRTVPCWA